MIPKSLPRSKLLCSCPPLTSRGKFHLILTLPARSDPSQSHQSAINPPRPQPPLLHHHQHHQQLPAKSSSRLSSLVLLSSFLVSPRSKKLTTITKDQSIVPSLNPSRFQPSGSSNPGRQRRRVLSSLIRRSLERRGRKRRKRFMGERGGG